MKVLGIADSDSYVKWGAATLERMPESWERELVLLRTPALPSEPQLDAALRGTRFEFDRPQVLDLTEISTLVAAAEPTVVLLSVRGPAIRVLVRTIVAAAARRPVLVSGMPGLSIPETMLAVYYRSQVDVFLLHSKREVRTFGALTEKLGLEQDFALTTLPFLGGRPIAASAGTDIVFAPQAKVPREPAQREWLVDRLIDVAIENPDRRVVVKIRGRAGEPQTHPESHPLDGLLAQRASVPANLVVATGAISDALDRAAALVTVSSTAALEAMARGVPVLALDDFGVDAKLINTVFVGSGVQADSEQFIAGRFRHPHPAWLNDNYFHAPADETWLPAIEAAALRRETGAFPLRPQFRGQFGGSLRRAWDRKRALGPYDRTLSGYAAAAVGTPLRWAVRRARWVAARIAEWRDGQPAVVLPVPGREQRTVR
ncbi:MAG TPA: DUF6716 putative glycosyltransferase [Naasia sp.]